MRLTGGEPPGEAVVYAAPKKQPAMTVEGLIAETETRLMRLIAEYDRPEIAYLSRPRPQFLDYAGDYDLLARVREWSAGLGNSE